MALVLPLGGPGPAYAISEQSDGTFLVALHSQTPQDIANAEGEMKRRGLPVELVLLPHHCGVLYSIPEHTADPRRSASVEPAPPRKSAARPLELALPEPHNTWSFRVNPAAFPAGQVLWIAVNDHRDPRPAGPPDAGLDATGNPAGPQRATLFQGFDYKFAGVNDPAPDLC